MFRCQKSEDYLYANVCAMSRVELAMNFPGVINAQCAVAIFLGEQAGVYEVLI
jgi:hypothetical protein